MEKLAIHTSLLAIAALAGTIAAGCSSGGQDARFPTAAEMGQLSSAPPPDRVWTSARKDVTTWDLKDPPQKPPDNKPYQPVTPWERLLSDVAAKRQGLLWTSEPMHCLAQQAGTFFLTNGGLPTRELTQFLAARCGVADAELSLAYVTGDAPTEVPDAQIFASDRNSVQDLIAKALDGGSQIAGIWAGRDKGKRVVMLPYGPRRVQLERVPSSPSGNHVTFAGEVLSPIEHIEALTNFGRFGFRNCMVDPRVRLPRFSVDCETSADDPSITIEVAAFPPGRILGHVIANLIVWPAGRIPNQYNRPSYGNMPSVGLGADLPAGLAVALNQVRKEAGLAPVVLNAAESATASRVAPHYFAALSGATSETVADKIVLGLRAGWQVPGLVGYGYFTSSVVTTTENAAALMASALERPSGRQALLDADARVLAVGPIVSRQEGVLASLFSTYTMLEPTTQKEVASVVALLNQRRKEHGVAPATLVDSLQSAAAGTARSVETGDLDPDDAINDLLQKSTSTLGAVEGWLMTSEKLDRLAFPDKLLTARSLRIAVGVAHFKPKGSPWGTVGVLVVTASGSQLVADAKGGARVL